MQTTPKAARWWPASASNPIPRRKSQVFAATRLATAATVISDRLWCLHATTLIGTGHERTGQDNLSPSTGPVIAHCVRKQDPRLA